MMAIQVCQPNRYRIKEIEVMSYFPASIASRENTKFRESANEDFDNVIFGSVPIAANRFAYGDGNVLMNLNMAAARHGQDLVVCQDEQAVLGG
jgi:hypothetical protein